MTAPRAALAPIALVALAPIAGRAHAGDDAAPIACATGVGCDRQSDGASSSSRDGT